MDPLSALGISIGSMALGDTLKEIAGDSAKDFAKDLFKERLKDWSRAADKSALERAKAPDLARQLRDRLAGLGDLAGLFDSTLFLAAATSLSVWGADEENRQLVQSFTKGSDSQRAKEYLSVLWAHHWPDDPELASYTGKK